MGDATFLFRLLEQSKRKKTKFARDKSKLGRYGGPLDVEVKHFTRGGCLHFLFMVIGFTHRPLRSQTEWFSRFSRGNIWWRLWWIFHPQEKVTIGKRRPEMGKNGMHGDAFTGGFGDFYTMKRSGLNNEFLLAKLLKFMEDEQLRSHDYYWTIQISTTNV